MEFDRIEALRIGQELKRIRRQRGLSLAEVENLSQGNWKAVVVGSYERADRAITVGRLSALMSFYQTPVSALFPQEVLENDQTPIAFDLSRREQLKKLHPGLSQYLSFIINSRGDWNGHILTIRKTDFQIAATFENLSVSEFVNQLRTSKLLLQWR